MLRVGFARWWSRCLTMLMVALAVLMPFAPLFAQAPDAAGGVPSSLDLTCLAFGGITGIVVQLLKPIGFIRNNPKWVAFFCSVIVAGAQSWYHGALPSVAVLTACVLTQLAGAVGAHEVVIKPVQSVVAGGDAH